ncbi:MAG: Glu-tRNA(Gln) amidotransferase subunit GatE [Candidatus Micrarchaeaceae archaeon]
MDKKFDYDKLEFKCGLEIHQRLSTKNKLFCDCLANFFNDMQIKKIERRQRAVAGELGKIDKATNFESKKNRFFIYELFNKSSCLVDADEEPPHVPNLDAIKNSLDICKSFNCEIPDEVQVMRKVVVDGSDPSSFQRTMLIGYDGKIIVEGKNIPITTIFLEEESSGIIKNTEEYVEYSLDRLGIPLVEIDTDPVIKSPQEAKRVSMEIGLLLRLTNTAQRGIGSIRQDVNISIKNGSRVEIKGFQELESMDQIIDSEIERQIKLSEIILELKERNAKIGRIIEITDIFRDTKATLILNQIKQEGIVLAAKLVGFKGIIGKELTNDLRLGTEISDYAKNSGIKGIIHSDEDMSKYGITKKEFDEVSKKLELEKNDSFIIIAEKKNKANYGMELALERAKIAMVEIPSETRGADSKKLNTRFLRPMAGKSRMYPETDVLTIEMHKILENFKPEKTNIEDIKTELNKEINNKQLAEQMLWSKDLQLYKKIINNIKISPILVSSILLEKTKELKRNGIEIDKINEDTILQIFKEYSEENIVKTGIGEILSLVPKNPEEVKKIIDEKKLKRIKGNELEKLLKSFNIEDKSKLLREIMSKYRLNIEGDELNSLINKRGL